MQKLLSPILFAVLVATPALADDYKWDPKNFKKEKRAKGDKYTTEGTVEQKNKITVDGNPLPTPGAGSTKVAYKFAHEVLAVTDEKKVQEERITVEEFTLTDQEDKDAAPDTSLKGHKIHVTHGQGGKKGKVEIEDDADGKVSEPAKMWAKGELGKDGNVEEDKMNEAMLPKNPIGDGAEWDGDAKGVAAAILKGAEIDAEKSKVKGKLSNVKASGGKHLGKLTFTIELHLKSMPTPQGELPFTEGGVMKLVVNAEGDLDAVSHDGAMDMKMDFGGKAEMDQGGEKHTIGFDQHVSKKETTKAAK